MGTLFGALIGLTFVGSILTTIPTVLVEWVRRKSPDVLFYAETPRKVLALTIDDGPSTATAEILDVLSENGAHATFFVIGSHVDAHPDVMARLVADGHELGHHMMYDEKSIDLAPDTFAAQFDELHGVLSRLGGSRVFRPGSGWYDDRMVETAARRGYRTVLGSVYPFDAQLPSARIAGWYVLQHAAPGAIVVLHDGPERGRRTADALRRILPELRRRGYDIVTVSGLIDAAATARIP
ncbi:MAG TPA: chitin deacetylase family protein [Longimicrobiales bacterium]